jgi:hypothetical protein
MQFVTSGKFNATLDTFSAPVFDPEQDLDMPHAKGVAFMTIQAVLKRD